MLRGLLWYQISEKVRTRVWNRVSAQIPIDVFKQVNERACTQINSQVHYRVVDQTAGAYESILAQIRTASGKPHPFRGGMKASTNSKQTI